MALAKPTKYPQWAQNTDGTDHDVVNPASGQNNVVEPIAAHKLVGWEFKEKPPRNVFNWLARLTSQWIQYLDEECRAYGTFDLTSSDIGGPQPWEVRYWRRDNLVFMRLGGNMNGTSTMSGSQDYIRYSGVPAALRPPYSTQQAVVVVNAGASNWQSGILKVNSDGTIDLQYYTPGTFYFVNWPSTGNCGLWQSVITVHELNTPA